MAERLGRTVGSLSGTLARLKKQGEEGVRVKQRRKAKAESSESELSELESDEEEDDSSEEDSSSTGQEEQPDSLTTGVGRQRYTPAQDTYLLELRSNGFSLDQVARKMRRTRKSVEGRWNELKRAGRVLGDEGGGESGAETDEEERERKRRKSQAFPSPTREFSVPRAPSPSSSTRSDAVQPSHSSTTSATPCFITSSPSPQAPATSSAAAKQPIPPARDLCPAAWRTPGETRASLARIKAALLEEDKEEW
ncbi:hypothetical protein JCM10213v2_008491 [Rhodosporidiobolus nylandii]